MRAVREEKESEKRESAERRSEMGKVREERARRKKMEVRERVEKSRGTVFVPMFCGSGVSKVRFAKAAGAEPFGRLRYQNCTRLWHVRSTSGS